MAWLTSILQNVGRTGSDINEAKTANLQEKQQKLAQQFKMQQFKAQMDELNQRLATGKAPQYLGSYQATTGQRFNTQRNRCGSTPTPGWGIRRV